MKSIREVGGEWYRAQSPATLARRLYGRTVTVKLGRDTASNPEYRMWTMVGRDGAVYGRLYEPIEEA